METYRKKRNSSVELTSACRSDFGRCYARRQRGAAALLATLILVVIASLSALVVNKAAYTEQKLSGVDIRSKEVYAAAVGGVEYATKVLQDTMIAGTQIDWDNTNADGKGLAGAVAQGAVVAAFTTAAGDNFISAGTDNYTPTISYTLITDETDSPSIIEIAATATAVGDTHIQKTVTVRYLASLVGTAALRDAPALLVEECIPAGAITGTPDIDAGGNMAIGSINQDGSCIDSGHFDFLDGDGIGNASNGGTLWETLFGGMTEATLRGLAALDPAHFLYVNASYDGSSQEAAANAYWGVGGQGVWNSNAWHGDVGSDLQNADGDYIDQVVVYFDSSAGCPPINGTTTIHGLVYYETDGCAAQGGGGGTVYGTTAFEGDLEQFNANATLIDVDIQIGDASGANRRILTVLPSSWKDF